MKYLVLIADLVASRQIAPREPLQERLIALLDQKNKRKSSNIVSPYTLTLGDEFQAVFSSAKNVLVDMIDINLAVYPTRIRYAFSIGEITTKINSKEALRMDGPAFHLARDELEKLKKQDRYTSITGVIQQDPQLLNAALTMMNNEMLKWRSNRLVVVKGMLEGRDVKSLATELSISEVAIYKNIEAGDLKNFIELINGLEHAITMEQGT